LIDDILDFTGTSASLGKGSLSDIHQGLVTAPILFAMEEFPQLHEIIEQGFDDSSNVDTVSIETVVLFPHSNMLQKFGFRSYQFYIAGP
jgi:geranylgeranyl pyrophosphate synthase